jgi:hypothetical protein
VPHNRQVRAQLDKFLVVLEELNVRDVIVCPESLVRELVQFQLDAGIVSDGKSSSFGLPAPAVPRTCYACHGLVLDIQEFFMAELIPDDAADDEVRRHRPVGRPAA